MLLIKKTLLLWLFEYRKFPNKGAERPDREEVRPYLKSRDQELSNGIWQPCIGSIYEGADARKLGAGIDPQK